MPKWTKTMNLECCECGTLVTIEGIDPQDYDRWKYGKQDPDFLSSLTNLSPLQHDQLIEELCNTCMLNKWDR